MCRQSWLVECCFTSTETVGLLGTGAQDVHLDFHTTPELDGRERVSVTYSCTNPPSTKHYTQHTSTIDNLSGVHETQSKRPQNRSQSVTITNAQKVNRIYRRRENLQQIPILLLRRPRATAATLCSESKIGRGLRTRWRAKTAGNWARAIGLS